MDFGHRRNFRSSKSPGMVSWHNRDHFLTIRELYLYTHWLAVSADAEGHGATGRRFTQHAAKLLFAFNLASVKFQDYIVFFQARLSRRRVLIDTNNFYAALFLKL